MSYTVDPVHEGAVMRVRLDLRQCASPAQELDPQTNEKPPSDAAHWPDGQGMSPTPKLDAAADGDGEGSTAGDAEMGGSPKADAEVETEAMEVEQAAVRAGSQQVAPTSGTTQDLLYANPHALHASTTSLGHLHNSCLQNAGW